MKDQAGHGVEVDPNEIVDYMRKYRSYELDDLLSAMTTEEKKAAARFNETCEDGEGYDISTSMMIRLAELGLVKHKGGRLFGQTGLMVVLENTLRRIKEES
jgi:hypothetical protein